MAILHVAYSRCACSNAARLPVLFRLTLAVGKTDHRHFQNSAQGQWLPGRDGAPAYHAPRRRDQRRAQDAPRAE